MKNYRNNRSISRAFTLIELLVAISIIGILSAITTASFSSARAKARDAKRVSDIANLQLNLALYFDRCNEYPSVLFVSANNSCPPDISLGTFIAVIPTPPTPATDPTDYRYVVSRTRTDYVLATRLENNNPVLIDALPNPPSGLVVDCDKTRFNYCVGPK